MESVTHRAFSPDGNPPQRAVRKYRNEAVNPYNPSVPAGPQVALARSAYREWWVDPSSANHRMSDLLFPTACRLL